MKHKPQKNLEKSQLQKVKLDPHLHLGLNQQDREKAVNKSKALQKISL